jgi:exodeoxyribonuclease VII small subunit
VAEKKTAKKSATSKPVSFETAMQELEALVARMEKGDHSLEDSLKDFERGVELTRQCQTALREAEQKVQQLMTEGNREELSPFDPDESEA